jgi:hypothetical protein
LHRRSTKPGTAASVDRAKPPPVASGVDHQAGLVIEVGIEEGVEFSEILGF